jgi:hypothetical protein
MGFKRSRVQIPPARFVNRRRSPAPLKIRETSTAFLGAMLIFLCAVSSATGNDHEKFERVKLNTAALMYAKELISEGRVVIDRKGAWAKDRPSKELENDFIRQHGFDEYAKWYLGIDGHYAEKTKRRYKFPYGDFRNVHRCGVLAVRSRAGRYRYSDIENAAAQLKALIEATRSAVR